MLQKTIASSVSLEGIGVHNGKTCCIKILPAPEDHGIIFARTDLDGNNIIPANYKNVSGTTMCTMLSNEFGASVSVVEHLCAALYGLGVSNALVNVDGNEIPILDGSSEIFVREIMSVGLKEQSKAQKILKIEETVRVENGKKWSSLSPADRFEINLSCDFTKKGLKTTPFSYVFFQDDFSRKIAPARTFGFLEDVEYIRKNNFASGSSLENTVVFDSQGCVINESPLRFENEPIRHKILDIIGDLSLSQYLIIGRYDGFCSGHELNNMLLKKLLGHKS
ncbi:MAG: UDP-3-O-acyl-N-acetylglucosamine deacetylase [Holosporaceae bacterium]|jgi:UDP-3-O-[3-hydroxymyristoyl] N-acetylglucosamine deacetylase|nr:UDP-3-O-acyl-N-acetylglucosamine deacetylase [Holosporaceae bacterium]